MSLHRIRLSGPWEWQPVSGDGTTSSDEWQRCRLPCEPDSDLEIPGGLWLQRRFHRPTGLNRLTQLAVLIEVHAGDVGVLLNGVELPVTVDQQGGEDAIAAADPARAISKLLRCEISQSLAALNVLSISLARTNKNPRPRLIAVSLEIRESP